MSKFGVNISDVSRDLPSGPGPAPKAGVPLGRNHEEYFSYYDLAVRIIDEINKMPQKLTPLARAAIDARSVLMEQLEGMGGALEDLEARTKTALDDMRQTRFAFVAECSQMLTPLKDMRQFFLGPDYALEVSRLKDFVDLCERLEGLKKRGVLDAVADTMLRLAEK